MPQSPQFHDDHAPHEWDGAAPLDLLPGENPFEWALRKLQTGDSFYSRADFASAVQCYGEALKYFPEDARLHWLTAVCNWNLGHIELAGTSLHAAVRLDPNLALAHALLGRWHLVFNKIDEALAASARALELAPQSKECALSRAWVLEASGDFDQAWQLLQPLIDAKYGLFGVAPLFARMARWRKDQPRALAMVDSLLALPNAPADRRYELHFAAADLLDSMGRYDEAFDHATRGNRIRTEKFDPLEMEKVVDNLIRYFTKRRIQSLPRARHGNAKPVFVVGMPRSGTSLVEQILASHPRIYGAGELNYIQKTFLGTLAILGVNEAQFPQCLERINAGELEGVAQIYLQPLLATAPNSSRIIDKMPLNFMHLGLISMLLPEAHVIHCRRNALDTCLSCYMTSFNFGNQFKYSLDHLAAFYKQYQRLMNHWKSVLELKILDVDYESLVKDAKAQSQRMLDFLGMPWDDRCLKFHETRRSVATSSVQQVRRPMYSSSIERWKHYEKHLGPLKAKLA